MRGRSDSVLRTYPEQQPAEFHEEGAVVESAVQTDVRPASGDTAYQIAIVLAALLLITTIMFF